MPTRVSKDFRFEAAHRLPWHEGLCANLHGHSYHITVSLVGEPDERGMVIDFKRIKALVAPLIAEWDHAVLIAAYDEELLTAVRALGSRYAILPVDSTAENVAGILADYIIRNGSEVLAAHAVRTIGVAVRETTTSEAYLEREVPLP